MGFMVNQVLQSPERAACPAWQTPLPWHPAHQPAQCPAQAFKESKACPDAQPEQFRILHRFQEYQDLAQLRFNFAGKFSWIPSSCIQKNDAFGVWSSGVFVWGIGAASFIALLSLIGVKPGWRTPCG